MRISEKQNKEIINALKLMPAMVKEKERRFKEKMKIQKLFLPLVKQILKIQNESES